MSTNSVADQIIAAVVSALGASGCPAVSVDRYRERPYDNAGLPSIAVYPTDESSDWAELDTDSTEDHLTVRILCRTRGDPVDEVLDPLYVWVQSQMIANRTWGSLALWTKRVGRTWEGASQESDYGKLAIDYEIAFLVVESDPTTNA